MDKTLPIKVIWPLVTGWKSLWLHQQLSELPPDLNQPAACAHVLIIGMAYEVTILLRRSPRTCMCLQHACSTGMS